MLHWQLGGSECFYMYMYVRVYVSDCRPYSLQRVERLRHDYQSLPFSHRKMLPDYTAHLDRGTNSILLIKS